MCKKNINQYFIDHPPSNQLYILQFVHKSLQSVKHNSLLQKNSFLKAYHQTLYWHIDQFLKEQIIQQASRILNAQQSAQKSEVIKKITDTFESFNRKVVNRSRRIVLSTEIRIASQILDLEVQYKDDPLVVAELKQIFRVRYAALKSIPDIWNQIVGCPISNWNYLPFGKRKVKQIDLREGVHTFPQYLQFIRPLLNVQIPTFNHLLINHYPSNIGIMPHTDGPAYKGKVFVISLGGPVIINFSLIQKQQENMEQEEMKSNVKVLLEDRSVHIFEEQAYSRYRHGINDYALDSIYLKQQDGRVVRSDLANFCIIKDRVQQMLRFSRLQHENFALIKIENNLQYNWKLQVTRKERVSITIRQKYHN